jgi:chaperonin GroEL (HSP60 family)
MVKEAAEKTNKEAGDGTTTTVILTYAMAKE